MTADEVIHAFEGIRRAQNEGRYAPHKPLLLLLALARVQQGESRLTPLVVVEGKLKALLAEFGPSGSDKTRHLPFWHLQSDNGGALWNVVGPSSLLSRPAGATPNLGELRQEGVTAGFSPQVYLALQQKSALLQQVARRVLEAFFPATLHADIVAELGLNLDTPLDAYGDTTHAATSIPAREQRRGRDPSFRDKVLRAYEYRCCVCGFDLRIGHMPAGLEAAHIHWHIAGGPDVEPNGLSLCALHHKLFDLGAFTVEPSGYRIVFSQFAISGDRGMTGVLAHHGRPLLPPQDRAQLPAPQFLEWNRANVFKVPERAISG